MEIINSTNRDKKRRKTSVELNTMVFGKLPPQARELEEAVLGAIMLEKAAFDNVIDTNLKPECFYVEAHQIIFSAMRDMQQSGTPIDILTVVEELKKQEKLDAVGGAYYITKLTNVVVSTAHIDAHARIILQKFIQRELIRISGEIIGDAYEDSTDVFDLLDDAFGVLICLCQLMFHYLASLLFYSSTLFRGELTKIPGPLSSLFDII